MPDFINNIQSEILFGSATLERVFSFPPPPNGVKLQDVMFTLYAQPAKGQTDIFPVDNLHFYFNGINLTQYLVQALKKSLDQEEQSRDLSTEYEQASARWLKVAKKLSTPETYDMQVEKAKKIAKTKPISVTLDDKLGNNSCCHLINFIFNQLPLPPISLLQLLNAYSATTGKNLSLPSNSQWSIALSSGPCRLYEEFGTWQPYKFPPTGSANLNLFFYYELVAAKELANKLQIILDTLRVMNNNSLPAIQATAEETLSQVENVQSRIANSSTQMGTPSDLVAINERIKEILALLKTY